MLASRKLLIPQSFTDKKEILLSKTDGVESNGTLKFYVSDVVIQYIVKAYPSFGGDKLSPPAMVLEARRVAETQNTMSLYSL